MKWTHLIFLFFISVMLHGQDKDTSYYLPDKAQLNAFKIQLLKTYAFDSLTRVQSRKSCNCGCNLIREKYSGKNNKYALTADDFCDSYVFTWRAENKQLVTDIAGEINALFPFVNDKNKKIKKTKKYIEASYEADNPLAYFKIKSYEAGFTEFILSLPYTTPPEALPE